MLQWQFTRQNIGTGNNWVNSVCMFTSLTSCTGLESWAPDSWLTDLGWACPPWDIWCAPDPLSGLWANRVLFSSDEHGPWGHTVYVGCVLGQAKGFSSAQTVGMSFIKCSFSSCALGLWWAWRRRYSSGKGQWQSGLWLGYLFAAWAIVAWSLFRRSLPSKGEGHLGITLKEWVTHYSFS